MQEIKEKKSQASEQARQDSEKLMSFINDVPHGDYRAVIDRILEGCMINYATLCNWRSGRCRIPELHKSKINEIAGYSVF